MSTNILTKINKANCVTRELVKRGFDVLSISIADDARPVIDVAHNAVCSSVMNAFPVVYSGDRIERMAAVIADCRVQWRV